MVGVRMSACDIGALAIDAKRIAGVYCEVNQFAYVVRSDDIVIRDHYVVRQHGVYSLKLSGEDLSRYSSNNQSVGLRKCPCCSYCLTKKMMSQ